MMCFYLRVGRVSLAYRHVDKIDCQLGSVEGPRLVAKCFCVAPSLEEKRAPLT